MLPDDGRPRRGLPRVVVAPRPGFQPTRSGPSGWDPDPDPPDPLIGFALLEITAARMSITFYVGAGIVRSPTYTIDKR